jgi:hypothetical protein
MNEQSWLMAKTGGNDWRFAEYQKANTAILGALRRIRKHRVG